MRNLEWVYQRKNCQTCARALEFFERSQLQATTMVDARKERFSEQQVLKLASKVDHIYATRGTKVVHLDLKGTQHEAAEITRLLIGPSGNLRAPTIKQGRKLIVGFHEETYKQLLT